MAESEGAGPAAPGGGGEGSVALFAGLVSLRQAPRGHRVGTDAVLLAAASPTDGVAEAMEFGAGVGAAGLALAQRAPGLRLRLVEMDPAAAALARINVADNGLSGRVVVEERDVLAPTTARVDLVLANPPWLPQGRVRVTQEKSTAHVMPDGGLEAWTKAALAALRPRGRLLLIHRADALPEIMAALDRRFGDIAVRPVRARAGGEATRILVCARKGSRAPFRLLPSLVLHEPGGGFTPEAAALHRGEALLHWS